MRIEFDPTNPEEAAAVRAMLTALHPEPWALQTEDGSARIESNGKITLSAETREIETPWADTETTIRTNGEDMPVTTDSTGTPWDARIHSTPPTTNKDGTWRAKRGVKAEEIAAVRAERTAPVGRIDDMTDGEMTEDRSEENPNAGVPVGEQEIPTAEDPDDPKHVVADPIVTAPPAPPAPIVQPEPSFLDVMKAITAAQKDGKIDTAKVKELCAAVGAGESTMGLNGPDNGDKRQVFLHVVALDAEQRDAIIAAAKDDPGVATVLSLLGEVVS